MLSERIARWKGDNSVTVQFNAVHDIGKPKKEAFNVVDGS
jgi:hypothetical protein